MCVTSVSSVSLPLGRLHYILASSPPPLCRISFTMFSLMHKREMACSHTPGYCHTRAQCTQSYPFSLHKTQVVIKCKRLSEQPCFHIILSPPVWSGHLNTSESALVSAFPTILQRRGSPPPWEPVGSLNPPSNRCQHQRGTNL